MDNSTVKRFILALAVQAEIEGMKAENQTRAIINNDAPAYSNEDFISKAEDLRNIAYTPDHQL